MKAIRLHLKQNSANYRREETVNCRMTYPLPPYSTVIGALHKACGYTEYHPMQISVQGSYGSLKRRMFKEDCFLNSLQNDRGILVKMENPQMLSSAYKVVATAQKTQGNDFDKGITINVVNQELLDEYRRLNRLRKRTDRYKRYIKDIKSKLKEIKSNSGASEEEIKKLSERVKALDKRCKAYEQEKYTVPKSYFRTLTKAPKQYEILCDIDLVIHIVSDEDTMRDILNNTGKLTAIGRGEDFVEVIDACETELTAPDKDGFAEADCAAYIPCKYLDGIMLTGADVGIIKNGTKYLIPKDYQVSDKKRIFNRIPVLYTSEYALDDSAEGVYADNANGKDYMVFLV